MPAYDDDEQRRLDYERELQREDHEHRLRLEEDERQRQLDEAEQETERQRQLDAEERGRSRSTSHDEGNDARSWNRRRARRTREAEQRRVHEDEARRWAERLAVPRPRPFIHLVFIAALLILLAWGAARLVGLYRPTATAADPLLAPLTLSGQPEHAVARPPLEAAVPLPPDPLTALRERLDASAAELGALRASLEAASTRDQTLATALTELDTALDHVRQEQQSWQDQVQSRLAALSARLEARQDADAQWRDRTAQQLVELTDQLKALQAPRVPTSTKSESRPGPTLPFRLVAIDLWNQVPYASVARGGRLERAAVGEAVAGWTLSAIDPNGRRVVFERDGRRLAQRLPR